MKRLARVQLWSIDPAARYGIEEAVARFHVPYARISAAIRDGWLKAGAGEGGRRVVTGADLIAWVEAERAKGTRP